MEQANQILSTFLLQQRTKANLKTKEVAQHLGCSISQVELWEMTPIKAPVCNITKLVELYKTPHIVFFNTIWNVQAALRKNQLL